VLDDIERTRDWGRDRLAALEAYGAQGALGH
jgi:hypothetical protein